MAEERPSWQEKACPAWCVREHQEDDMDGDRDHQSDAHYVPIIRMVRRFIGDKVARDLIADELIVAAFQAQADSRPSITIVLSEDARICLDLRDESAERVSEALTSILSQVGGR